MLSDNKYIRQSLELHLFFARIMKEHSFFLQISFTPRDSDFMQKANAFRLEFDKLLGDAIQLSNGVVSNSVLNSGEVITPYTMKAEMASEYYTGINIPTFLTEAEVGLRGNDSAEFNPKLEKRVYELNNRALSLIAGLIQLKTMILSEVVSCRMFTTNYPLLIDHILREAKLYYKMIQRLQNHEEINMERDAYEQEAFWNRIMAEHSKFICGLLDPTENELKEIANNFGKEFDKLTREAIYVTEKTIPINQLTEDSMMATQEIKKFKQKGTQGLIECKIKSVIIPLLGDHTLREANHFLRLLKIFSTI